MTERKLERRIALVTGASSGIGAATARRLARDGATVILVARRRERIEALAAEIGGAAVACTADVGDLSATEILFAELAARFGGIDLLVNNAGIGISGNFTESSAADWKTQIDANLYGVLNCSRAALPFMTARAGAMIVNVSSVGGRFGFPGWAVYCATKYAVVGFTEALRKEVGSLGIRVVLMEPGMVHSEFGKSGAEKSAAQKQDSNDRLQPDDIAENIAHVFALPAHVLVQEIIVRPVIQLMP